MVRANKRNEALRIESALLNKIAMLGTEKTAEAVGVDKSQISRWKRDWIPKFSMLLAVLEWLEQSPYLNLKSNMDRFIATEVILKSYEFYYLKSNMDRFIEQV